MNKKVAIIVAVVVILVIGVIYWLMNDSLAPSSATLNGDRGVPFGTEPSTSGATPSTSAPKAASTPASTGTGQTADKQQAASLINQSNASANEFNTMNNSAGQIDPNTSL